MQALVRLCTKVRAITRSKNQDIEIPDALVIELIHFLQKTEHSTLSELSEREQYQFVELVLIDYPTLIDPYSKGLHMYDVSSSWHQLVPKECYVSFMVDLFVYAFRFIIDHPSDLLQNSNFLLLIRNLQSMHSCVHGNLPYLLEMVGEGSTDENTQFLRRIQWLAIHENTEKVFSPLKSEQLAHYQPVIVKNHQIYIKNINNPEKVADSFHVLEKSLFVWFSSICWKKAQSSERALLYRIVLDLGRASISHILFKYFCPARLICTVCQIVTKGDIIDLREKDLCVFETFRVLDNPAVKQIISRFTEQDHASHHKRKRVESSVDEVGEIPTVKIKIDLARPLERFSIDFQFKKFHNQLLEVGLFSYTERKLFYTPDMREDCTLTNGNFLEFSSIPGDRFKLVPGHIDVLQKIGQEFIGYYNGLIEYGISEQNPIVREHAFKWCQAMEAFLADPSFGVDFECLCIDVLSVISYLKHFGDMTHSVLAEIHTSMNDHLKRYQGIAEKYDSEFFGSRDSSLV